MIKNWDKTAFCKLQQFLGHKYFQKSLFNLAQNDKKVRENRFLQISAVFGSHLKYMKWTVEDETIK